MTMPDQQLQGKALIKFIKSEESEWDIMYSVILLYFGIAYLENDSNIPGSIP